MKKFSIIFEKGYILDLQNAVDFYKDINVGLAKKFSAAVDKAIDAIIKTPLFRIRYDEIRCYKVRKFPYLLHFSVDEKEKLIKIYGIICTYRNPEDSYIKK